MASWRVISVNVGCDAVPTMVQFPGCAIIVDRNDEERFRLDVGHYLVSSTGDAG